MPLMIGPVLRAEYLKRLSDLSNSRHSFGLDDILTDLRAGKPALTVAGDHGLVADDHEAAHLREHWHNENGHGYWPDQPVREILLEAYIALFELVIEHDLPVHAYWITGANDFQVCISVDTHAITFMILTPPITAPADDDSRLETDTTSWTIKWDEAEGRVVRTPVRYLPVSKIDVP